MNFYGLPEIMKGENDIRFSVAYQKVFRSSSILIKPAFQQLSRRLDKSKKLGKRSLEGKRRTGSNIGNQLFRFRKMKGKFG